MLSKRSISTVILMTILWAGVFEGLAYVVLNVKIPCERCLTMARQYYMDFERNIVQYDPRCAHYDKELTYLLNSPGCEFNNREYQTKLSVNSLGVRDSEAALHTPEVVVMGDSGAFGWGLAEGESFPSQLAKLNGLKVLNTAVPSYGTARELLMLKRVDLSATRFLVLQFCENDQDENLAFVAHQGALPIMPEAEYSDIVNRHMKVLPYFPGKFLFYGARSFLRSSSPQKPPLDGGPAKDKAAALVKALALSPVSLEGKRLIVLELNARGLNDPYFAAALRAALTQDNVPPYLKGTQVLDIAALLKDQDYYFYDDHPRARAHAHIAQELNKLMQVK